MRRWSAGGDACNRDIASLPVCELFARSLSYMMSECGVLTDCGDSTVASPRVSLPADIGVRRSNCEGSTVCHWFAVCGATSCSSPCSSRMFAFRVLLRSASLFRILVICVAVPDHSCTADPAGFRTGLSASDEPFTLSTFPLSDHDLCCGCADVGVDTAGVALRILCSLSSFRMRSSCKRILY